MAGLMHAGGPLEYFYNGIKTLRAQTDPDKFNVVKLTLPYIMDSSTTNGQMLQMRRLIGDIRSDFRKLKEMGDIRHHNYPSSSKSSSNLKPPPISGRIPGTS